MRLHRFYISEDLIGEAEKLKEVIFSIENERLIHQWRDVFKFSSGDQIYVFNQEIGEWLAEFTSIDKKNGAKLKFISKNKEVESSNKSNIEVALYMAIIKNSNFDLVVEKATELGVSRVVPIMTERTVKSGLNYERLRKISIEAIEQSGQICPPEISESLELKEAIINAKINSKLVLFGHITDDINKNVNIDKEIIKDGGQVAIFIGPEGGWTDKEVEMFKENKVEPISLSNNVLRAETAAIVSVSKILG